MITHEIDNFIQAFLGATEQKVASEQTCELSRFLRDASERSGTVYFLGNGASASISSTLAFKCVAEQGVPAVALTDHNLLLGMSRKGDFASWMSGTVKHLLKPGDAVVLTSSSGESPNVINATLVAAEANIPTFSLTGFADNNQLRKMTDGQLWVDSGNYNVVESTHLLLGLIAVRGIHQSAERVRQDYFNSVKELSKVDWEEKTQSLTAYADQIGEIDYRNNRIIFIGDGSSASLASHLATDFSKSQLTAQALNDHSFLSAAQNDFGSTEWLKVGFDRSFRPGDEVIIISHANLFPAEDRLIERLHADKVSFSYHGTQRPTVAPPDRNEFVYQVTHHANELVLPSIGLLAIAEAFLAVGGPPSQGSHT